MAHQAIYRKWRPMVFDDVVGQNHITKTLKNQIISQNIGHAYLFCGTRGTGKTTCAKIFSRAVNCLNPQNGNPCNECEICRGIIDGTILDVNEMDGASNRKIDNIREIINDVYYVASTAKYTVYIIDEVHMLTTEAFNALLKTLEEPPERVIFILATTDPQKVPQTILSRCQRFDFRRIKVDDIVLRLREIAYGDGLNITDGAYKMLARLGDGSMRDSLSVLERIVSACGNEITEEDITDTLGISKQETVFNITDAVINKQTDNIISIIGGLLSEGKDLNTFADDLIAHFRDLMICSISQNAGEMLDYSNEDITRLMSQSKRLTFEKIYNAASLLADAKAEAKWVKSPRVIYELALIKLTRPEIDTTPEALMDRLSSIEAPAAPTEAAPDPMVLKRLDRIERYLKNNAAPTAPAPQKEEQEQKKTPSARLYTPMPKDRLFADDPVVITAKKWESIVNMICKWAGYLSSPLQNRPITIDADGLILMFDRKEKTARGILEMNWKKFLTSFKKAAGGDIAVKIAYEDELEDNIIDYWSLPQRKAQPSDTNEEKSSEPLKAETNPPDMPAEPDGHDEAEQKTEAVFEPAVQEKAQESEDIQPPAEEDNAETIEEVLENFKDIVELTDNSEFKRYNASENNYRQQSLDENEEAGEEFLDESELDNNEE